jgi:hypothetical protein
MLTTQVKEALIVAGITIVVLGITLPKMKKNAIPKPDTADKSEVTQKENARIALDAFMTAVENGENNRGLQQLNSQLGQTYGLRIYKKDNYYVAKDSTGKEILYAK